MGPLDFHLYSRFSQSGNLNRHMRVHGTNGNGGGGGGVSGIPTWHPVPAPFNCWATKASQQSALFYSSTAAAAAASSSVASYQSVQRNRLSHHHHPSHHPHHHHLTNFKGFGALRKAAFWTGNGLQSGLTNEWHNETSIDIVQFMYSKPRQCNLRTVQVLPFCSLLCPLSVAVLLINNTIGNII